MALSQRRARLDLELIGVKTIVSILIEPSLAMLSCLILAWYEEFFENLA
jgi:hypothetical protein